MTYVDDDGCMVTEKKWVEISDEGESPDDKKVLDAKVDKKFPDKKQVKKPAKAQMPVKKQAKKQSSLMSFFSKKSA